jgi:SAM-dependent methyltransferase
MCSKRKGWWSSRATSAGSPTFLDVGVGVAGLSISMCRAFPSLAAVGLDVLAAPLALARENVARAGLASRVELRMCAVQDLDDRASFDLAWLPLFFLDAPVARAAAQRVFDALRPGGWVVLGVVGGEAPARDRAVRALMRESWGGSALPPAEAEALLRAAAFADVRSFTVPPWAPTLVVARRPGG